MNRRSWFKAIAGGFAAAAVATKITGGTEWTNPRCVGERIITATPSGLRIDGWKLADDGITVNKIAITELSSLDEGIGQMTVGIVPTGSHMGIDDYRLLMNAQWPKETA